MFKSRSKFIRKNHLKNKERYVQVHTGSSAKTSGRDIEYWIFTVICNEFHFHPSQNKHTQVGFKYAFLKIKLRYF